MTNKRTVVIGIDPDTNEEWETITETDENGEIISVEIE